MPWTLSKKAPSSPPTQGWSDALVEFLALADVQVNGDRPWDVRLNSPAFFRRVLADGTLGLGESYMDGDWDCDALDEFFHRVIRADLAPKLPVNFTVVTGVAKAKLFNPQSRQRSQAVAKIHYDLGNDFYAAMLDKRMQYTCAYWRNAQDLDQAQEHKLDMICSKLQLGPRDRVLELGCGWGGFARFAAERYGCHVTAYNISSEQVKYARERCKGLPVEIRHQDYRDAAGEYDKVVSVGMCEHVGPRNYRAFLSVIHRSLVPGGLALVHTIGGNKSVTGMEPWLGKYIFPGAVLPSIAQLAAAAEGLMVVEDWHNFGPDYDRTLMAWHANFRRNWHLFRDRYGDRFERMWNYYLLLCAGSFRARKNQLWQVVFSKGGVEGGYRRVH